MKAGSKRGAGDEEDFAGDTPHSSTAVDNQHVCGRVTEDKEASTMADDDFDLDAMLDSALDEGFADPAAAQAGGEDDGDIDLDAMLDEAMVASVLEEGDGAAAAEKPRYAVISAFVASGVYARDAARNSIPPPPPSLPFPFPPISLSRRLAYSNLGSCLDLVERYGATCIASSTSG